WRSRGERRLAATSCEVAQTPRSAERECVVEAYSDIHIAGRRSEPDTNNTSLDKGWCDQCKPFIRINSHGPAPAQSRPRVDPEYARLGGDQQCTLSNYKPRMLQSFTFLIFEWQHC